MGEIASFLVCRKKKWHSTVAQKELSLHMRG